MSRYKSLQVKGKASDKNHVFGPSRIEDNSFHDPIDIEIPNYINHMQELCINIIKSIFSNNYDLSNDQIIIIYTFFHDNHHKFYTNIFNAYPFIQIFEENQFFTGIIRSFELLIDNHDLFHNIIIFIKEIINCNGLFCQYLSDILLLDFIQSLGLILNSEIYEQNIKVILQILSKLFDQLDSQNDNICAVIPIIYSIIGSFFDSEHFPQNEVILFISNVVKKIDDVDLCQALIQFLLIDNSINNDTFSCAIEALYIMMKRSNDIDIIVMVLQSEVLERFTCIYFANEYILETLEKTSQNSHIFSIYMKVLTKILKFFNDDNVIGIQQPNIRQSLVFMKNKIFKQVSQILEENDCSFSDFLYSKLEGLDTSGRESCHTVIKFIFVLSQQECLKNVFTIEGKLIHKILLLYNDIDEKGKEKILQLILYLMNYSDFYRDQIFNCDYIDFTESFTDFVDNACEKSIQIILDIIDMSLKYFYKKNQNFNLLTSLYTSEEFMESLYQGSQEILNEELKSSMYTIWTNLDSIVQEQAK